MTDVIIDTETTGLNPLENELVAIGVRINGEHKIFARTDKISEKDILTDFWFWLSTVPHPIFIGYHLDFDWTFLKIRSIKHRVVINHLDKYSERKDIRTLLNSDRFVKGTRMVDYCKAFGIPDNDEIDGSQVPLLWIQGHYHKIKSHLEHDLRKTEELFVLLQKCGVI